MYYKTHQFQSVSIFNPWESRNQGPILLWLRYYRKYTDIEEITSWIAIVHKNFLNGKVEAKTAFKKKKNRSFQTALKSQQGAGPCTPFWFEPSNTILMGDSCHLEVLRENKKLHQIGKYSKKYNEEISLPSTKKIKRLKPS